AMSNASGSNIETLYRIADNSVEALEFIVRSEHSSLTGIPLKDLDLKSGILICAIFRGGKVIIPRGNDTIESGDHVVIVTSTHHMTDLSMILK
ncbi:MAG: Trk system potassium transporter TrkA, partial [Mogibacterium sp.]|nr:Trk system potassium transporter TrkA [Mogibacterium sp.]